MPGSKGEVYFMKKSTAFDYQLDFKNLDFRQHPELYRVGKGEQGVLLVEPYKSELLPHWRFKNEVLAQASAEKIYGMFQHYLETGEFVGADMARKFLQMGFTRARRYANHQSGKKYATAPGDEAADVYPYFQGSSHKKNEVLPQDTDALTNEKARAANIFRQYWFLAKNDQDYLAQKKAFTKQYIE